MYRTKTGHQKVPLIIKILLLATVLLVAIFARAASADNVVQGYAASEPVQPGMVVTIDKAASKSVKPAPADNSNLIYGVAVDPSDAPITLVGQNSKVFVATTGTYQVLVTAGAGPIKPGDYISMSSINGIAGKAQVGQPVILGKAQSSFNGNDNVVSTSDKVKIGRVYISIGVAKNPLANSDPTLPFFLRKVANSVANRSVPVIRVYTALLIFLLAVVATVVILWSGVNSSLISLGRNPLSRHVIFSGMYKVVFTGLGVLIIGLAGVYLLLKV
ncbi:hypothetical protein KW794_01060 [Candidatus Saccharibacteria bacterium]|nr:hypothetical protein [Candidatus Saccharibacteria bacterium]